MDVKQLYTDKIDTYLSFNAVFRSPQALRALFAKSGLLRPELRVLDAGCGTGVASLALLQALQQHGVNCQHIHGFDLTPAMLERFRDDLARRGISNVEVCECNVLELDRLPSSWTNYDLIVSVAMLEYIPREKLALTLTALRARLAPGGRMLLVITRRNWITRVLIEQWWKANRYRRTELDEVFAIAGFESIVFRRFPYSCFWQNQWAYVVEGHNGR